MNGSSPTGDQPQPIVEIVGMLDDGPGSLTGKALRIVEQAEVLVGGTRHLAFFPGHLAEKWPIRGPLGPLLERLDAETRRVVVLASGDPNFFGIAGTLVSTLGRDRIRIHPNVSAMALAFARVRVTWDGAVLHSVHGRSMDGLVEVVRGAAKVGLFTDAQNSPAAVGSLLLAAGVTGYRAYVCEHLSGVQERVVETDLPGLLEQEWAPLNVLVLVRE
ncbi:MAG: precorrin-6y C5,15-methyltransferase (decarboxylating) subunit CbiE [Symbiobacteriia bacterium]